MIDPKAQLDVSAIVALISFFLPLLVSAVTKKSASDGVRAVTNIVLSAVSAVLGLWISQPATGSHITWQLCVNTFIGSLLVSFGAYKAFWKPTGVAGTVTEKTANFGLGSPPTLETADKGAEEENVTGGSPVYESDDSTTHVDQYENPLDHVGEEADAPTETGRMP